MLLTAEEARVLGSLVEKELTTPDQYPLTIKSLLAACNQASNRDPVVEYDESTVMAALDSLKAQRLIRFVLPSHGRTAVRYRHVLNEALGLDARQGALLAVLALRGPQTVGELRARTERMASFDGLDEVDHELRFLAAVADPLTMSLGRRLGQKEERWTSLLVAPPAARRRRFHPQWRAVTDQPGRRRVRARRVIRQRRRQRRRMRRETSAQRWPPCAPRWSTCDARTERPPSSLGG